MNLIKMLKDKLKSFDDGLAEIERIGETLGKGKSHQDEEPTTVNKVQTQERTKELRPA